MTSIHFTRVYVSRGIFEYCNAAQLDILRYCKSIEPALPPNSSLTVYDPRNPLHVDDILNNGAVLVDTAFAEQQIKLPPVFSTMHDTPEVCPQRQYIDLRKALPDQDKNRMVSIMKSCGIEYSKDPLRDQDTPAWSPTGMVAQQKTQPKKNNLFHSLVEALNNDLGNS